MTEENAIIRKLDAQLTARRDLDDERVAEITRLREALMRMYAWLVRFDSEWDATTIDEVTDNLVEIARAARCPGDDRRGQVARAR
jgi:hypothetical protein